MVFNEFTIPFNVEVSVTAIVYSILAVVELAWSWRPMGSTALSSLLSKRSKSSSSRRPWVILSFVICAGWTFNISESTALMSLLKVSEPIAGSGVIPRFPKVMVNEPAILVADTVGGEGLGLGGCPGVGDGGASQLELPSMILSSQMN